MNEFMRAHRQVFPRVSNHPVLLLGEDNPQSPLDEHALWPHTPNVAGGRLQRILGLPIHDYLGTWRTNLVLEAQVWDRKTAKARVLELWGAVDPPWDVIVLLGAKVSAAYGFMGGPAPCSERRGNLTLVSVPHPSGRARAWNDGSMIGRVRAILGRHCPSTWPLGTWVPA